jgi:hypothetical protein
MYIVFHIMFTLNSDHSLHSINQMVSVMVAEHVYCKVRTEQASCTMPQCQLHHKLNAHMPLYYSTLLHCQDLVQFWYTLSTYM